MSRSFTRTLRLGVATAAALAVSAPSALAACPDQNFSTVFSAWNDQGLYTLAPNGNFESGSTGWALTGDATLVADNPALLASRAGQRTSLQLAGGATATTPPFCVSLDYRSTRMFSKVVIAGKSGKPSLQVDLLFTDSKGNPAVKTVSTLQGEATWSPTSKMSLAKGQLKIKSSDDHAYVRYRFTALNGTTWRIDDLWIDPRFRA